MGRINPGGAQKVRSVDIADLVGDGVDLLKMDIEGAEYACLGRLIQSGRIKRVKNLVAELHFDQGGLAEVLSLIAGIEAAGFVTAIEVSLGPWMGGSVHRSPFSHVADQRMFANFYAWQP